jgi:hypothetical protein
MEFIRQKHRQTVGTDSGTLHLHTIHTPGESPAFSRDADGGVEMLQIHSKTWRVLVSERRALWGSTLCVSRVPQPPDLILYALQQVKATFAGSITNRRR